MLQKELAKRLRGRFEVTPILPPTRFPDGHFDVIYLYSVFSHLSEAAHLAWLREFNEKIFSAADSVMIGLMTRQNRSAESRA